MAKQQEPVRTEKLKYDISLYNIDFETRTTYKAATLKFLINSLKKLEGNTKQNAKVGKSVKGSSTNSKNTKPNVNQHLKIK